jgi:hypothetical protein
MANYFWWNASATSTMTCASFAGRACYGERKKGIIDFLIVGIKIIIISNGFMCGNTIYKLI